MQIKKMFCIMIVLCLIGTFIPSKEVLAESLDDNENLAAEDLEHYEQELEIVKNELEVNEIPELDIELDSLTEESFVIDVNFDTEDIEVDSQVEMNLETEELFFTATYTDENMKEIEESYQVIVEKAENDIFIAEVINIVTGEKFHLNSEELQASILPAVIVGFIVRAGARAAISLYSRTQLIRALTSVSFSTKSLQSKFKHAIDFGVKGSYSKANAVKFETALRNHVSTSTHIYRTKISGQTNHVILHLKGNNAAFFNQNGVFISGWRLNASQLNHHKNVGELLIKR